MALGHLSYFLELSMKIENIFAKLHKICIFVKANFFLSFVIYKNNKKIKNWEENSLFCLYSITLAIPVLVLLLVPGDLVNFPSI